MRGVFLFLPFLPLMTVQGSSALDFVDPLIGTEGRTSQQGGMMPYVCVPFGSFHMVPMTRQNRVGQLSFNSSDKSLLGFVLTRQPAIWMGDWGEVRIPIEPELIESAEYHPHCGRVTAGGRKFEYTATMHAAWLRGDLAHDVRINSGGNSSRADFDQEGLGRELPNFRGWRYAERIGNDLKIGVSLISIDQARANLEREIGSKSFEQVAEENRGKWEKLFARVDIEAPSDVKTIFYTGLFHSLLYPRLISEYGRYYSGFDDKVHDGEMYACYSLWDTYRAEHAFLTLFAPERVDGMMQSLLEMYREGGWLPIWPNLGYTSIMMGAPAEIVLAEAYRKGFRGFDLNLAYEAVKKNATVPQYGDEACDWRDRGRFGRYPETRGGLESYMARGYVSCDLTHESVSRTLDFGLADCAAAILADATGHQEDARMLRARSKNYTNLWCSAHELFLPRFKDGRFKQPSAGDCTARDYCEQAPHTAIWSVPFDTDGLAELLGGKDEAVRKLDGFFDTVFWVPERGNRSIHGNEPSHHCAYLFNRFGRPDRTQFHVHKILTKAYSTDRKGFDGNEDCGQMSAWYILSSLGFYPVDPASGEYELGSPIVKSATIRFGDPYPSATLNIVVRNYSPGRWRVRRVMLNGRELVDWRVKHADLVGGGELVFEMID